MPISFELSFEFRVVTATKNHSRELVKAKAQG